MQRGEVSGMSCRPLSVESMMPPLLCLLSADVIWLALLFIAMTTSWNVMGCAIRMVILTVGQTSLNQGLMVRQTDDIEDKARSADGFC